VAGGRKLPGGGQCAEADYWLLPRSFSVDILGKICGKLVFIS
jgi:hypothetical protein